MNSIKYVFYFVPSIIVLIIFFYIIKKRNTLSDIEKNNISIYSENCGGRFDFSNYTIPFVKLSIRPKFLK